MDSVGSIAIRRAGPEDVAAVTELMRAQNRYHADLVPHIVKHVEPVAVEVWCVEQLASPDHAIFLAESGREGECAAVGLVMLHVKAIADTAAMHGIRLGFVDELYVRRDARREGVARALLDAAREEARTRDCHTLSLNVWAENAPAIEAYAALGFKPIYHRLALPL